MRIKPTMSMHLSISDLNADLVEWQQERIKRLEVGLNNLLNDVINFNDGSCTEVIIEEAAELLSK